MNKGQPQRRSKGARSTGTRDRLLSAAREVVAREGVDRATSRQITDTAGANLAAVTYHFGSKDALVSAALLAEIEALVEPAFTALEGNAEPASRLLDAVQLLLRTFTQQRGRVTLYFEAVAVELRSGAGDAGTVLTKVRSRLASAIAGLRESGAIPGWVEADPMAALIVATAQGLVLQSALDPHGPSAEAQAGQLAKLLLEART